MDFIPEAERIRNEDKIERWGAYKEMRSVSDMIAHLRANNSGLQAFCLPDTFVVRPLSRDEVRVLTSDGLAFICQMDGTTVVSALQEMF